MNDSLEFTKLVADYYAPLYRFGYGLTGSEADACDLVQETFYIWVRKGRQLAQPAKVKSWLFTTLYREFLQTRRHQARFPHFELSSAETELPAVPGDALAGADARRIVELMQQVQEPFRSALSLFYLEDYTYEEIAEIISLPLGTVKSRISRGVSQLRQILACDLAAGGMESRG
jgi:RNA polymerase sigma-70 factor, ECF subfamily